MGRMAPNERPVCDALAKDLETWEDKALHMLDILKDYQCMATFFEHIKLTPEQLEKLQSTFKQEPLVLPPTV
jgi:hypothetical protein